jgi:hypothetical protein
LFGEIGLAGLFGGSGGLVGGLHGLLGVEKADG